MSNKQLIFYFGELLPPGWISQSQQKMMVGGTPFFNQMEGNGSGQSTKRRTSLKLGINMY